MNSSSSRAAEEQQKQADIRKQIALLQSQLKDNPDDGSSTSFQSFESPKRKQPSDTLLAPATPSPKKQKRDHQGHASHKSVNGHAPSHASTSRSSSFHSAKPPPLHPIKPARSNVISNLAGQTTRSKDSATETETVIRSSGFGEKPAPRSEVDSYACHDDAVDAPKRDDRLALIEELEVGPIEHKPPFDDPHFKLLEPNSLIRLSSRTVPHDDVQAYLTGRYYLSPSRLYSNIRLLPSKQGYDVPVVGDWVTIAVVAERGPVKYSKAPVGIGKDEDGGGNDEEDALDNLVDDGSGRFKFEESKKSKPKAKDNAPPKPSGKKYVNMKLIDFGARSSRSSASKATIRGDAFLSLLLFESDGYDTIKKSDGSKAEKIYKGGSRGAFESMSKLKEGDVVALLNPKVLKPFQRSADGGKPHPTNNILAVTPESASSILVLGRAKDLGMCQVLKRDGKVCGSWCDKRVSDVCEWHVQTAVERRRSGRAEFSIGTSGMSTSSGPSKKPVYDPARQWGLKPEPSALDRSGGGGSTYVMSGHIIGSSSSFVAENVGREGQAKAKRKSRRDADRELKVLLTRGDKEGMRAVVKAREVAKAMSKKKKEDPSKDPGKGKNQKDVKGKAKARKPESDSDLEVEDPPDAQASTQKNAYNAQVIKQLGFDPTVKPGQKRIDDSAVRKKLDALAALQSSRKDVAFKLGPRPGQRIRSGVVAPKNATQAPTASRSELPENLSDSDDEEITTFGKAALLQPEESVKMVDLDGSSDVE